MTTRVPENNYETVAPHYAHVHALDPVPVAPHVADNTPLGVETKPLNPPKHRASRYGITGFVIGVLFWHLVGFWDFVTGVVLSGSEETNYSRPVKAPRGKTQQFADSSSHIETGSIQKPSFEASHKSKTQSSINVDVRKSSHQTDAVNCSVLQLDRRSGNIVAKRCEVIDTQPGEGHGLGRQDMAYHKTAAVNNTSDGRQFSALPQRQQIAADGELLTIEYQN